MLRYVRIGLAVWILGASGCASRGNVDVLESQLRQQEDQLFAMHSQLSQTESDLALARREVEALRGQLTERGDVVMLPEQSQTLHRLAGIRLHKYFTGGLDRDGEPGDELLNVVVVPHDDDGETVKLPGDLEIEAIDLAAPEQFRQVGTWRFSSEEVARSWQSGLAGGFQFRMPWQSPPLSETLVLHAKFRTVDGRQFGTSAEIRVTPAPEIWARSKNRKLADGQDVQPISSSDLPPKPLQLFGELKPDGKPPAPGLPESIKFAVADQSDSSMNRAFFKARRIPTRRDQAEERLPELLWTPIDEQTTLQGTSETVESAEPVRSTTERGQEPMSPPGSMEQNPSP